MKINKPGWAVKEINEIEKRLAERNHETQKIIRGGSSE